VIEQILPGTAVADERFDDAAGATLFPEEREIVARAVEKRRREFATARGCAHRALQRLGVAAGPILAGGRGEPIWPAGVVGSITHCHGYRGCAVARRSDVAAVGVDAEPHASLPEGLIGDVADGREVERVKELTRAEPSIHWDRLLFSAKEAVYKAWFPLAERWLGFEDTVLSIDPLQSTFSARLRVPGPLVAGIELSALSGRWLVDGGLVLTAVTVRPGKLG
jgi:4'-phosphopantetheinyl transferase EntD